MNEKQPMTELLQSLKDDPSINAMIQGSPVCHKIFDPEFRLRFMSKSGIDALKIENIEDFYGHPFPPDSVPKETREIFNDSLHRAANGETNTIDYSFDVDGKTIWYRTIFSPFFDDDNNLNYIRVDSMNITDRKEAEESKRIYQEKIIESQKMQAIGQLAGGIAHDFNNQLACLQSLSESVRERTRNDSELKQFLDNIFTIVKHSGGLTKKLLAFSRKGKYKTTEVDIHRIIFEIVSIMKCSIDKIININQHLNAKLSITEGDPSQLQNALLNLVINAYDAIEKEGEINIGTEVVQFSENDTEIHKNEVQPGEYIKIYIQDTGKGMDDETKAHIFEPFFTTKEMDKGTGMGLAAVYGIIKNHFGFINYESKPGEGTTAFIYLPVIAEPADLKTEEKKEDTKRGTGHILFVDDEIILSMSMKGTLSDLGYTVSVCRDGKEAVEFYKKSWKEIDLAILDMNMPKMNGRDAFFEMKKINPNIKAIIQSGYSIDKDANESLYMGVVEFIEKPFSIEYLSGIIAKVLSNK